MYFKSGLILNSGAIERFQLDASFDADGFPKPIILDGTNGSGKTNFLSILADAFLEIAAQHYVNVLQPRGVGHTYFRIVGGRSQRSARPFEVLFESRFYEEKIIEGDDGGSRNVLSKGKFCNLICDERKNVEDFEKFKPALDEIRRLLLTP